MGRYSTLFALNFGVFLMMAGVGMVMAILPARMLDFTRSASSVGYLATVFAAFYLLFQIPVGRLADRIGFRLLIGSGFAMCGCAGMVYCMSEGSGTLLIGRALQGIGEVPVWALAPAMLSILYPESKGRVMGLYNASFHLGLSAGPFTGLLLNRMFLNPDAPIVFYIASSLTGALFVWSLTENPARCDFRAPGTKARTSLRKILHGRQVPTLLAGVVLYGTGYGLCVTLIPAYLIAEKGFDPMGIGVYFTLFYITISIAQLAAGPVSDRCGRTGFMISGQLIAAMGIAFFPELDKAGMLALLTIFGLGLGMFFVTSLTSLNEAADEDQKGAVSGIYFLSWGAGYFLGPMAGGILGEMRGLPFCFRVFGCLLFLEALLLVWWRR